MSRITRPKMPVPARDPVGNRAAMVGWFLRYYLDHDRIFAADLLHLTRTHGTLLRRLEREYQGWNSLGWRDLLHSEDPQIVAYVADLSVLLARPRYRLNQIPEAAETFHGWCTLTHSLGYPASGLSVSFSGGAPFKDITVHVQVDDTWLFMRERRAAAKARLLAACEQQIDAALDRIYDEATANGWLWPRAGGKPEEQSFMEHIGWTYRRFAKGESAASIAACVGKTPQAVSHATKKLATLIGISFS